MYGHHVFFVYPNLFTVCKNMVSFCSILCLQNFEQNKHIFWQGILKASFVSQNVGAVRHFMCLSIVLRIINSIVVIFFLLLLFGLCQSIGHVMKINTCYLSLAIASCTVYIQICGIQSIFSQKNIVSLVVLTWYTKQIGWSVRW